MRTRPPARAAFAGAFSLVLAALAAAAATLPASAQAADTVAALAASPPLGPVARPLWLRYSAIAPDGRNIAFAYQGNLFVVPTGGGMARLLVGNGHHSFMPVWSPDSRSIAYASDPFGNFDVFLIAADGGPSRRLTTHSASETPLGFTPDGHSVMFSAQRLDARTNAQFPARGFSELYQVPVEAGRRPQQMLTTPALRGQFNKAGTLFVYEDLKGVESPWRKHHVSPVARDIWLYDVKAGSHRQLTTFGGEDRNPVWSPDEQSVYYLSEKSGSSNVWKMPAGQPEAAVQITRFTKNPVRFLSIAADGMLCFGYDGEIYTQAGDSAEPRRVELQVGADTRLPRVENLKLTQGATEFAINPDGQELAFVVRGEIFVSSSEFGDTRRITDTPAQERSVSFSPDGRRLLFASEREGSWNLYEASLVGSRKEAPYFFSATRLAVKTLLKNGKENFQPRYSPDGKEVAYLENRATLKVLNLASGQTRLVLPGALNYSYSDGDQWFEWTPDGQSLLVNFVDTNRWSTEVGWIDAQGKGPLLNLTKSGYEDQHPMVARHGEAMIWLSDRNGLHGTGGSAQTDVYEMFLTRAAFERFKLDRSEYALLKKREDDDQKADDKNKGGGKDGKGGKGDGAGEPKDRLREQALAAAKVRDAAHDAAHPAGRSASQPADADAPIRLPPPVTVERDGVEDRVARLTPNSGNIRAAAMTPDGETLVYVMQTDGSYEVWVHRLRSKELRKAASFAAPQGERMDPDPVDVVLDAKGENGFVLGDGGIRKFKLPKEDGDLKLENVKFTAEMRLDRAAERAEMFEHVWRQTREKLYVADMNGVDWVGYRQAYAKFLPHLGDNADFAELLSEMLGELDVSHTGAGYRARNPDADATASLGLFYDDDFAGAGVKVAEVIAGGPLDTSDARVRPGMVIEKIDGVAIAAGAEFDSLLNHKAGKRAELSVLDPSSGRRFEQPLRPISGGEQSELLYKRWVKAQRDRVERLSGGRLGYVHVRSMSDESYREVYAEVLGRYSGREALIVDTRFNGGGNLHDELATFLAGKRYLEFVPRGQSLGFEPSARWTKPSLVLISEANYSDAHLFPWTYQHLGIGKLVGMPVAGTGTAVWWETLQDPTLVFGIPEVGFRDAQGRWMEKLRVDPDIRIANDPALLAKGRDQQIEAAVQALLAK